VQLSTCGFTQIGNETILTVGRDGAISYDPVHGSMLHIAEDSLPDGIDEVTVTRNHGYNSCKLHPNMQVCSATVYFKTKPPIKFTKDIFIELPHSFSSVDTQDLCFVKYVTGLAKRGLPHTSDLIHLKHYNFLLMSGMNLKFSQCSNVL